METFISIVHILVAFLLIVLVLIQDSKGGSMGGAFGGGNSNSVFGPMGAATLAQQMTRYIAILFAVTCVYLTILATHSNKSVIENTPIPVEATAPATPAAPAAGPAAPEAASEAVPKAVPAAPAK